ncbi:MAG: nucleotidyltransferase domain-containing protein [Candidatus Caldatribacteriota bacterium]
MKSPSLSELLFFKSKKKEKKVKIIVKMIFGSHLYGTNTENSDTDYKGIFLPTKKEIYLNNIPKSINTMTKKNNTEKNSSDDIDTEIYSLHYFLKLACEGQTVAIDMLHASDNMILESSDIWKEIVLNRQKFYTKNLSAFVGYARKQAAKYGIKGSRLEAMEKVINYLNQFDPDNWLDRQEIWNNLPTGEHIHFLPANEKTKYQMYQVCGKKFLSHVKIENVINSLQRSYDEYGKRAQLAKQNIGVDWKAVSHAIRAAIQMTEIYTKGDLYFPLKQAELLRNIKEGKLDYETFVAPILEKLMDNVEELANKSGLPEKVNKKFWDDFLVNVIEKNI